MSRTAKISEFEFILLMAFLMSNVALCIDAILPALPDIGLALQHADTNDLQLMITMIFLGLGIGELFFGTLSDALGRKPIVYVGVGIFLFASFLCVSATSLDMMLLGRALQGVGLSAPRTVSIAVIRDIYQGSNMARIMSFIKAIFIVVPMIAPLLGQWILNAFDWQAIFYFQLIFIGITVVWFALRQRETLPKEKRKFLRRSIFSEGIRTYFSLKEVVLYTLVAGLVEGSFILYLSNSQHIFQEQYLMVEEFPYIFAGLSFVLGIATFFNGAMVMRYGMKSLVTASLYLSTAAAVLYVLLFHDGINPPLWVLLTFLSVQFLSLGFIFGNLSAMAMRPLGDIAGIGAALYSFMSMLIGVLISMAIGKYIVVSTLPVFIGLAITGLISLALLRGVREASPRAALRRL